MSLLVFFQSVLECQDEVTSSTDKTLILKQSFIFISKWGVQQFSFIIDMILLTLS